MRMRGRVGFAKAWGEMVSQSCVEYWKQVEAAIYKSRKNFKYIMRSQIFKDVVGAIFFLNAGFSSVQNATRNLSE